MEQRRLLLAFGLSLLLLMLYQDLLKRYHRVPDQNASPKAEEPIALPPTTVALEKSPLAAPAGDQDRIEVDTDLLHARISRTGGRLVDLELKKYRRDVDPASEPLDLIAEAPILPLTIELGPDVSDAAAVYSPDRTEVVAQGEDQATLMLTADGPNGLHLEKRFTFSGNAYTFGLSAGVSGDKAPHSVSLVLTPMPLDLPTRTGRESAIALADGRLTEKLIHDLETKPVQLPSASWVGFAAQYFLLAAVPDAGNAPANLTAVGNLPLAEIEGPLESGHAGFTIYAGPKDRDVLRQANHQLDRAVDFGWFWFVAIPLLQALRALHGFTGNYGVAIILLTTLVKLATVPLTQTTFRNMREMQKIQPQMTKLRERFKDDQVALQKEMMELYKRHRVNPLSGCLPMLLQLPILYGLYNALSHAIELRHAPFALWINDLSAPDRLMVGGVGIPVLTIVMGASMLLQQRLMPQQGDPTQQRMMMFTPLIFTFMSLSFPAGLVLYWLVNNLLSIGQQYMMLRSST